MLTKEENELLCRVGPGTPMGALMRRYWIPACMSSEVPEADGAPKRVRLLGEDLVAYRDSEGKVGVLDEHCAHRGASLALARNEECGLRCLYHGWKFDHAGNIVDMPAEPEGSPFKDRVKQLAYPVEERGGLAWVYMGPPEKKPPFPEFFFTTLPDTHVVLGKSIQDCNWAQSVEGDIDTSHAPILHGGEILARAQAAAESARASTLREANLQSPAPPRPSRDLTPRLEIQNTEFGFQYAGIYKGADTAEGQRYVRVVPFIAPIQVSIPPNNLKLFVPIDDYSTWHYVVAFSVKRPLTDEERERVLAVSSLRVGIDVDENFHHLRRNKENNYLQDREAMRQGKSWTGMIGNGLLVEDAAVTETMGSISDRTKEHLGAPDIAVVRFRRLMLESVRKVQAGGDPLGLDRAIDYRKIRSWHGTLDIGAPWQDKVPDHVVLENRESLESV